MNIKILNMLIEMIERTDLLKEKYGVLSFESILIEDCGEFYKLILRCDTGDPVITIPKDVLLSYETKKTAKEIRDDING